MAGDLESSFAGMLLSDVADAMERHRQSGSQAEKRNLVRTSFAAVEGLAWIFREHVVDIANSTDGLEPDERQVFSEMSFNVSEQGKIVRQARYIPFLPMLRLVARTAHRMAPEVDIDFSGEEWDRFRNAVAIRNRITHPKGRSDLVLTEEDITTSLGALVWFLEQIGAVMAATNVAARAYLGGIDQIYQQLRSGDPATTAAYNALLTSDIDGQS